MRNNYTGPHTRSLASEGSVTRGRLGGGGYAGNILHGFKGTATIRFPSGEMVLHTAKKRSRNANPCNVLRWPRVTKELCIYVFEECTRVVFIS